MATMAFDANYYMAQYQDVREAVASGKITAEQHWKLYGWKEERNPNAEFNTAYYAAHNTDVVNSGMNYLDHYLMYGSSEAAAGKRLPNAAWESIDLTKFDKAAYLAANQDVKAAGMDALQHYMLYGRFEASRNGTAKLTDGTVITSPSAAAGMTFTLTTNPDTFTGNAGNDTFNGTLINKEAATADATSTLNVSDVLDGVAGTDTLNVLVAGANSTAALNATLPVSKNIEVLSVKNLSTGSANGVTIDASTATSLTQIINNASTGNVAVTGVAANSTVSVQNSKAATTVTFANDTFKAATTVANIAVNSAGTSTTDAVITLNDGGTVAATGLTIQADGTNYVTTAGSALSTLTTLTVTGSGSLDFDSTSARNASLTKVDASALQGGLTFTAANTAKTAITGGHGADVISIAANFAGTSTISLGDGNDTVKFATGGGVQAGAVIDGGAGVDTFDLKLVDASNVNSFANFEVASLDNLAAVTYDLDLLAAKNTLTGLSLTAGGTAAATVSNIASGSTLTVNGGTTSALVLSEKGADVSTSDSLNIAFSAKANASLSTTINNVETINIVSGGDKGVANTFNLTTSTFSTASASNNATEKLVVTGANALTLDASSATASNTKVIVDGSAATGNLTINGGTTTTTITGGSGDDLITVGATATIVDTGAGKDVVDVKAAFGNTNVSTLANLANGDSITAISTAAGKLGAATSLAGATDLATILSKLATAADSATTTHTAWAAVGTDVYLVVDGDATTAGTALAADNVIKLTGVTDLSTWTADAAGHITVA